MIITVSSKRHFETLIQEHELVFLYFWADWCAPCAQFSKVYAHASDRYPDYIFAKVHIEEQKDLAELFKIRSIPHLIIFKQGLVVYSDAGSIPETTLFELIRQSMSIDIQSITEERTHE